MARRPASVTTPFSRVSPDPASQSVAGIEPIPTTATDAASSVPSSSTTVRSPASPRMSTTPTPKRVSAPFSRCRSTRLDAISAPTMRVIGSGTGSTTVTWQPKPIAAAAISVPMKPPPTTTTCSPAVRLAAIRRESSSVRSCRTPDGGCQGEGRAVAPVAMTSTSYEIVVPSASDTRRLSVSSPVAARPRRRSRSRSSSSAGVRSRQLSTASADQSDFSRSFDSGGRSYGSSVSAPMSVIGPVWPRVRRFCAVRVPASEAPMITTWRSVPASLMMLILNFVV